MISPNDFLSFAESAMDMDDEVGFRNAISRAYYSMFHQVMNTLKNPPTGVKNIHKELSDYLQSPEALRMEPFDKLSMVQLSALLKQQKSKRCFADYDLSMNFSKTDAKEAITIAKRFFAYCQKMLDTTKQTSALSN